MGQVIKMYMLVGHCALCINNVLALFPGVLHASKRCYVTLFTLYANRHQALPYFLCKPAKNVMSAGC